LRSAAGAGVPLQPCLRFDVAGIVHQHALVGRERPAQLAARLGKLGIAQIELGIGRVAQDLGVDARQLRGCAGAGLDGLRRTPGRAEERRGDKRRDSQENTLHAPSAHDPAPRMEITAPGRFA
jgi:hypothetical protein